MVQKNFNPDDIDEDFLISTIKSDKSAIDQKKENKENKSGVKKNVTNPDYLSTFLRRTDEKARFGKNVPIRQEHHERIRKIVRIIGEGEISIFDYIDNVLTQHFKSYKNEIIKLYNEKNEDIF